MFGVVDGHCNRYLDFNHGEVYLYINPVQKPDGANFAFDSSGSMGTRLSEVKMIRSMFFAAFNVQHRHPIQIGGGTSIADAVKQLSGLMGSEETLVVVTDGVDLDSTSWKFIDPTPSEFGGGDRRLASLLDYLEKTSNARIFLVGVGREVKDFLRVAIAPGRRMQVASVPDGADAKTVATVLKTGLNAPKRVADAPYTLISIDAPATSLIEATEEEQTAVSDGAATISIGSVQALLSVDEFKKLVEDIETAIALPGVDLKYARACLLWFFAHIIKVGKPLPGAIVGAKYNHAFSDPAAVGKKTNIHYHLNKMCSDLSGTVLRQHAKTNTSDEIEGRLFKFTEVNRYTLYRVDQAVIDTAMADGWAMPQSALVRAAPRGAKREREVA